MKRKGTVKYVDEVSTLDKFEYKASADEIKALIAEGEYVEAMKIADKIDWRRVRSVMMLCTISDLYKINRRFQESKDVLLMAYEKHPTGRLIIYSLCELAIKMGEYDEASRYYKEFVQIAPRDTGRYVLQYRLYEALDVSIEERIAVLEEFKKREPKEKWVYELAYLYHRIGLTTKCVEECDEMFIWFGEGRYVIKALELKALHQPLSPEQQEKYDAFVEGRSAGRVDEEEELENEEEDLIPPGDTQVAGKVRHGQVSEENEEEVLMAPTTELPEVKTVDVGQYNTINLQMELAESMKEILEGETPKQEPSITDALIAPLLEETEELPETNFSEEEAGPGQEALLREEEPEDFEEEPEEADETAVFEEEELEETETFEEEELGGTEAFKEKEPEEAAVSMADTSDGTGDFGKNRNALSTEELQEASKEIVREDTIVFDAQKIIEEMTREAERLQAKAMREQQMALATKPTQYDKFLSQEYDGQISFVVPDAGQVEKQITGQLSIDDIMAEWEQKKKDNEEKRMEDVRRHILAQTGSLFASFDEATKNGLLEELEKAFMAAIMKESGKNPHVKKVIFPEDAEEDVTPAAKQASVAAKSAIVEEEPKEEVSAESASQEETLPEESAAAEASQESGEEEEKVVLPVEPVKEGAPSGKKTEAVEPVGRDRELSPEEQELFGKFVHQRKSRRQLVQVLDNMSLASCTGNVLISGEEETTTLSLAKALVREMQLNDSNFSGKVAKVEGHTLNKKDVEATFGKLAGGALIITEADQLKPATVVSMLKTLEKENMGLLALVVGTKNEIAEFLSRNERLTVPFNLRVDIEPLDDESLVAYAKQYAEEMEYSIDEFGILALHTRIADRQTSDHEVTLAEVRELVDEAIGYANKKTPKHFMDILLAKRYDEEDMIILREKDFMHN